MNKEAAALEYFGRVLIGNVRDATLEKWTWMLDGEMKGDVAQRVQELIKGFGPDRVEIVKTLLPAIVDDCLHHLLWTFEQSDQIKLSVQTGRGTVADLNSVSDGLAGELYSPEGWIARFSKSER